MKGESALRPGRPAGPALRSFGRDIIEESRAAIDPSQGDDTKAVHDFRKAMKRWRAFMRLLAGRFEEAEQLRRGARDLARTLGHARDTQGAIDALGDIETPNEQLSARSLETIRARLHERRHNEHRRAFAEVTRAELRQYVENAAATFERWPLEGIPFIDLAEDLSVTYRRARQSRPVEWYIAPADELHDFRRRVVEHRHQIEIVEPLWPRLGRVWIEEAQRLRTRLGAHQDLMVLRELCGPHQPLAPWRSRIMPLIEARQATHVGAAARLAGRLFAERPRDFRRRLHALWEAGAPPSAGGT